MHVCLCICWWNMGCGRQFDCDQDLLIYQRPHLSCMTTALPPLLRWEKPSPAHPHPSSENSSFGRSLMLMSCPGLSLAAVNRELTRLVVCLYTVVTHLKDGLCPEQVGSFQVSSRVPSQTLTQWPCPKAFHSHLYLPLLQL